MDASFEGDQLGLGEPFGLESSQADESGVAAGPFPIKKLSDVFDNCAKSMPEGSMRVYLRVRPSSAKAQTEHNTITVESDTTIVTNAPDSSRRAQYTQTEERHYVRC